MVTLTQTDLALVLTALTESTSTPPSAAGRAVGCIPAPDVGDLTDHASHGGVLHGGGKRHEVADALEGGVQGEQFRQRLPLLVDHGAQQPGPGQHDDDAVAADTAMNAVLMLQPHAQLRRGLRRER